MKKIIRSLIVSLLCIGLISGCSKKDNSSQESVTKVNASGKLVEQFNSIKELKENAYDMVEVYVKSNDSKMYNELHLNVI